MDVLPVPPIVGQNSALLPDGQQDTAHAMDCGEANLSMILEVKTTLLFAPGSIRQAMGLPEFDGRTTGDELAKFLRCMGIEARNMELTADDAWGDLGYSRHHGQYHCVLGKWIAPTALHWYLFYQRGAINALANDPWTATRIALPAVRFRALYAGEVVTAKL